MKELLPSFILEPGVVHSLFTTRAEFLLRNVRLQVSTILEQ